MFKIILKMNLLVLLGALLFTGSAMANTEGDELLGFWFTENDKATVEVYRQGDAYFGKIVALKEPLYPEGHESGLAGKPKVDRNNPDVSKQGQRIIGLKILRDFAYLGDNKWQKGKIYDAENGKDYDCNIKFTDDNSIAVRGYVGLALFGRTTEWRRTTAPEQ